MKIFICSEMNSPEDLERRRAARDEITEIGHTPDCFEDLPGRRHPKDKNTQDMCLALVRESDFVLAIVDDTVTGIMESELKEARHTLGEERIFYYFTREGKRDDKSTKLWDHAKNSYVIRTFDTPEQLAKEISRSFASYAVDSIKEAASTSKISLNETVKLKSGVTASRRFRLEKGKTVTITCTASYTMQKFNAGFFSREEYFRRRPKNMFANFNFGKQAPLPHYTKKVEVDEDDDYYLIIRAAPLIADHSEIKMEVRVD